MRQVTGRLPIPPSVRYQCSGYHVMQPVCIWRIRLRSDLDCRMTDAALE